MTIRTTGERFLTCPPEDTFAAFDLLENRLGFAGLISDEREEGPLEYKIVTDCQSEALPALLGAAVARAIERRRALPGRPARVYAECTPDDKDRLEALRLFGFYEDDQLLRLRARVVNAPITTSLREHVAWLIDSLRDEREQAYFLERRQAVFGETQEESVAWLRARMGKKGFARIVLADRGGLVGETVITQTDLTGEVEMIYTSPAHRRQGVGRHMLELARQEFSRRRLWDSVCAVRTRVPGAMGLMAGAGYRKDAVLALYPGIDL